MKQEQASPPEEILRRKITIEQQQQVQYKSAKQNQQGEQLQAAENAEQAAPRDLETSKVDPQSDQVAHLVKDTDEIRDTLDQIDEHLEELIDMAGRSELNEQLALVGAQRMQKQASLESQEQLKRIETKLSQISQKLENLTQAKVPSSGSQQDGQERAAQPNRRELDQQPRQQSSQQSFLPRMQPIYLDQGRSLTHSWGHVSGQPPKFPAALTASVRRSREQMQREQPAARGQPFWSWPASRSNFLPAMQPGSGHTVEELKGLLEDISKQEKNLYILEKERNRIG